MAEEEIEKSELAREIEETIEGIQDGAKNLVGIVDVGDIVKHLRDFVWPAMEAVAEVAQKHIADYDELALVVDELVAEQGEMLTAETAGMFANAFLMGRELATELEKRLGSGDAEIKAKVKAYITLLDTCEEELEDVVGGEDDDGEQK